MQIAELFEFCMVVKHNFFHALGAKLPPEFTGHPDATPQLAQQQQTILQLQTENEQLQAEIARLRKENEKLNDRVDLLLKKL